MGRKSLMATAPAIGADESVLAHALARATVPDLGVDGHEFAVTDLPTWLAGPQQAQASAPLSGSVCRRSRGRHRVRIAGRRHLGTALSG
jgi:hypothetical protein